MSTLFRGITKTVRVYSVEFFRNEILMETLITIGLVHRNEKRLVLKLHVIGWYIKIKGCKPGAA
jgi:hypothetical protein